MYNVSDLYRKTLETGVLKNRVAGKITLKNGNEITVDDSNIVSGSLSIDNKCVNNNDFSLGSVYVGQLSMTIYGGSINRYSLYDGKVELSYFLTLTDGTEEEIPLGVYFITEPVKTRKLVNLKCYDAMNKLDISIEEDSFGTAFELLTLACNKANIELANTQEELAEMCNGEMQLSLEVSRIQTYRDFVSYCASVLGGFATINRFGKLEIKQFSSESNLTIPASRRIDATVHDYETFFNSIYARFIAEENFYPYTEEDKERPEGLLLDMGDIPIVQGTQTYKKIILHNIFEEVEKIRYTPSEFSVTPDVSIDLGDLLTLENANYTSESVVSLVTSISWTYHKEHKIVSNGSDALYEAVADRNSKQLADMEAQLASKNLVVKTYTNAADFTLNSSDQNIIRLSWSAFEKTTAIFGATIPVEMSLDGNLILTYQNGMENKGSVTKYLSRGKHFVTITNYVPSETNERISWRVNARVEYFESDSRKHDAKIISILDYINNGGTYTEKAVDTSVPSAKIAQEEIKAFVFAQGLNATIAWDGTLDLTDDVSTINLVNNLKVLTNITEKIITNFKPPEQSGLTDTVGLIDLTNNLVVMAVNDYPFVEDVHEKQTVAFVQNDCTESTESVIAQLKTEYHYEGQNTAIDEGQLNILKIMTSDKQEIESLVIK